MLLVDGRLRWRSGPGGEVSGSLLGEVVDGVVEQLQIFRLLLDWSRVSSLKVSGGQVGAGGLEASGAVGGRVAVPGGVNARRPVQCWASCRWSWSMRSTRHWLAASNCPRPSLAGEAGRACDGLSLGWARSRLGVMLSM